MDIRAAKAVVTGGASGLGAGVGRYLASRGAQVTLVDLQAEAGQKTAADIGPAVRFIQCDVTQEAAVEKTMQAAADAMGGINLLVNCAGIIGAGRVLGRNGPMAGDFFTKVIHVNLIGTFLCDKAAASLMQHNAPN